MSNRKFRKLALMQMVAVRQGTFGYKCDDLVRTTARGTTDFSLNATISHSLSTELTAIILSLCSKSSYCIPDVELSKVLVVPAGEPTEISSQRVRKYAEQLSLMSLDLYSTQFSYVQSPMPRTLIAPRPVLRFSQLIHLRDPLLKLHILTLLVAMSFGLQSA